MNFFRHNSRRDGATEEMDSGLRRLQHPVTPADPDFRARLKTRLLEARASRRHAPVSPFRRLWQGFPPRPLVAAAALALIAVIVTQALPFGNGRISRLLISDVSAAEFELVPSSSDAAGAAPDAAYLLTSTTVDASADDIKASLTVSPDVPFGVKKLGERQWSIAPQEPLPPNTIFQVTLAAEAADGGTTVERDFEWAFQVKDRFKVLASIPRDRATGVPTDIGVEITFSQEGVKDIADRFRIEPAVPGRFETVGRTAVFVPSSPLAAGTLYTVRLDPGLGFEGSDETLAEEWKVRFETAETPGAAASSFRMSRDTYEYAVDEVPTVQVNRFGPGLERFDATVYRFDSPDAFLASLREQDRLPTWSSARARHLADVSGLERARTFSATPEQAEFLDFLRFPEALPRGFYLLELSAGDVKDQAWIQVGDAAAYVQATVTDTLVWVNSLASGNPMADAQVRIEGTGASARTGRDGIATFATPQELMADPDGDVNVPQHLRVSAGADVVFVPIFSQAHDRTAAEAETAWSYLSSDRPLYQTDDTLRFWGVAKRRTDGKPFPGELTVSLRKEGWLDAAYQPVRIAEQSVTADAQGTVTGEIRLENLKPDYYTLELRAGETVLATRWLNVSPYVKPAYQLAVTPDRAAAFAGEPVRLDVAASFFDGTPVPDLALTVAVDGGSEPRSVQLVTDALGKASFTHDETYADCGGEHECWPRHLWFTARPQQAELGEITAASSVQFFGPRSYVTSKVSYPSAGRARVEFKVRRIDLASATAPQPDWNWSEDRLGREPVPGAALEVEVIREWFERTKTGEFYDFISKRVVPKYSYTHRSETVERFEARADASGTYVYERGVKRERSYKVLVRARDGEGRVSRGSAYLWHFDGRSAWQGGGMDGDYWHVQLPDRPQGWGIGETVEAQLLRSGRLPEPEAGTRFLFLQLQRGLQEHVVSDDPTYRFPFEARDVPNVHLLGVHFNGKTYVGGEAWWSFGTVVPFRKADRALTVEVTSDKSSYAPGGEARLDVRVTDPAGRPVAASVNLNVVDEAYYAVASETVDPLASLYAGLPSGSLYGTSSHLPPVRQSGGAEKGCFLAGTEILMADGTRKPIERVRVGDQVMTLAGPESADKVAGRVSQVFRHVVRGWLTVNGHVRVTPEHLVYANGAFRQADELKVGDWLLGADGRKVPVTSIERHEETAEVFNFTVEPYHTYIAEGLYVHNDKGGGGPRRDFADVALFRTVITGRDGRAQTSFTLPDNLTSWRITAQAVAGNLYAGTSVAKIPVSLPAFVEPAVGASYLTGDRVIAKLRAYGAALTSSDEATFEVSSPSLGLQASLKGRAFTPVEVTLPPLTAGHHDVTYAVSTSKGDDAALLPIDVVASHLQRSAILDEGTLTVGTTLKGKGDQPLTVVLSDAGRERLYAPLQRLAFSWTDRLDQAVARRIARELLAEWYGQEMATPGVDTSLYQAPDGGLALLPYSTSSVDLSARAAIAAPERFDRAALAQYFFSKLEPKATEPAAPRSPVPSTPEEVTWVLGGLAALGEPVLTRLQAWERRTDLDVAQRLTIAQAYASLGAGERARALLLGLLQEHGRMQGPYAWLETDKDGQDARSDLAARAAALAVRVSLAEHEALWAYVQAHRPKALLLDLEEAAYLRRLLPKVNPKPAAVTYTIDGRGFEAELTERGSQAFSVAPDDIDKVAFEKVEGSVAYAVRTLEAASAVEGSSREFSLTREYRVNGQATTRFKDGDLVEVRLTPKVHPRAAGQEFQVTDLLPGGLTPVTSVAAYGATPDACAAWLPYGAGDQRVTFRWYRAMTGCNASLIYYARVTTKGTYRAEPALLQGYDNVDAVGLSAEATVTIE